jgi:hypothetical protein
MAKERGGGTEKDAYAQNYMAGSGAVLLRDKFVGRAQVAMVGFVALWCALGAIATFAAALPKSSPGVGLFLVAMTAFFAFIAVGLGVVRTVVSERELWVQCAFWGPRVPVERIRDCRVVPFEWMKFGGWGIKRSRDGTWAYVVSPTGNVVEVTWTTEDGKEHKALFSASNPAEVVAAVNRARGTAVAPGARVATDESSADAAAAAEAEAERELAEGDAERAKRREG